LYSKQSTFALYGEVRTEKLRF